MLTSEHNLGKLSRQFDTLEEATANTNTSFVYDVWVQEVDKHFYLSTTFKKLIPLIGNRLSLNENNEIFYLIIDSQGKLLNKIKL